MLYLAGVISAAVLSYFGLQTWRKKSRQKQIDSIYITISGDMVEQDGKLVPVEKVRLSNVLRNLRPSYRAR